MPAAVLFVQNLVLQSPERMLTLSALPGLFAFHGCAVRELTYAGLMLRPPIQRLLIQESWASTSHLTFVNVQEVLLQSRAVFPSIFSGTQSG